MEVPLFLPYSPSSSGIVEKIDPPGAPMSGFSVRVRGHAVGAETGDRRPVASGTLSSPRPGQCCRSGGEAGVDEYASNCVIETTGIVRLAVASDRWGDRESWAHLPVVIENHSVAARRCTLRALA